MELRLGGQWSVGALPAGVFQGPDDADRVSDWRPAIVPGTVAAALLPGAPGNIAGDAVLQDYDDLDWVFRTSFEASSPVQGQRLLLELDGLATVAEAWLNDTRVLESRNMFRSYALDVSHLVKADNQLCLVFRALNPVLGEKRPRPRWKTRLVDAQNLRYVRTTLLGRIASWTPKVKPVGPWRPVRLRQLTSGAVEQFTFRTTASAAAGEAVFRGRIWAPSNTPRVVLEVNGQQHVVETTRQGEHLNLALQLAFDAPPLWWPHTHGGQAGLEFRLLVDGVAERSGVLRFRELELNREGGKLELLVNRTPVFCRGACWTTCDLKSLQNEPTRLRSVLEATKRLGMNLIRIGGTMAYEDDGFYALCDELGLMVWQEFMFANMDYPFADEQFRAEVTSEVTQVLSRLAQTACVVAYCGGSEVEQQAAMVGLPKPEWSNEFVGETLPRLCAEHHPQTVYFPSSPCGGDLPFHTSEGVAHYYGVGAYQRDVTDLANARVKFASECLGFSNIPAPRSLQATFGSTHPAPHHPGWKAGVPRDNAAGWDFEDIRDHYLKTLFGVDPIALRYSDLDRYFALSAVVTGEVMAQVFTAWRHPNDVCAGGIAWFLNDIVPGAGWGLIDSSGALKPAAFVLGQALQPRQVLLADRGLEGHAVALVNETDAPCAGTLIVELWQHGRVCTARAELSASVEARGSFTANVDALLGHFHDTTWSYRFGPRKHEAISARWLDADGRLISQAVRFVGGDAGAWVERCEVQTSFGDESGVTFVEVKTDALLHYAQLDLRDCTAIDNFVHLIPGQTYRLRFQKPDGLTRLRGDLTALNYADSVRVASS